ERRPAQPLPCEKLLHQRLACSIERRPGTFRYRHSVPRPHYGPALLAAEPQPPASPFLFQAGFPARVALPTGLAGDQKVEGDDQFFRCSSFNPVSKCTTASA